jgi:hypothetical protein
MEIKLAEALKLSDHINDIVNGKIYKDGIYKDDDTTLKPDIKERDIEELMNIVKFNTEHLTETKKYLEEKGVLLTEEEQEKINSKKMAGEEFYLKGSTNFMSGFDNPKFYVENENLFFSVKVIDGEVDLAEITRAFPGKKPSRRIEGGTVKDGLIVKVPIEIDYLLKALPGTVYTVLLTSTNNQMKASFNYTFKG